MLFFGFGTLENILIDHYLLFQILTPKQYFLYHRIYLSESKVQWNQIPDQSEEKITDYANEYKNYFLFEKKNVKALK